MFSLISILNNEPGETIPLVVRQTIDYLKNNGTNIEKKTPRID